MRSVVSISMPAKKKKEMQDAANKAKKSLSTYVLEMYEMMQGFISEDELLEMSKKAEKNYKKGKTKELKNLADLIRN